MSFADIPEDGGREFKANQFVKIEAGIPLRLRVLDKKALHTEKHFLPNQKVSVLCLGDDVCPICINNQKLIRANPDSSPRQIKGLIFRQNRYLVNVLNRTLVKRTPSGNVIFSKGGQFPTHDPDTGELLVDIQPEPLNRVEILERGPTLFSQLNAIMSQVTDEAGNSRPLTAYDIVVMATGHGRKMTTNVIPYPNNDDEVVVPDEDKYALETIGIRLSPEEITKLVGGTSLRDIFEMRRDEEELDIVAEEEAKVGEDVKASIDSLFPN
jgi:hypothetical protein